MSARGRATSQGREQQASSRKKDHQVSSFIQAAACPCVTQSGRHTWEPRTVFGVFSKKPQRQRHPMVHRRHRHWEPASQAEREVGWINTMSVVSTRGSVAFPYFGAAPTTQTEQTEVHPGLSVRQEEERPICYKCKSRNKNKSQTTKGKHSKKQKDRMHKTDAARKKHNQRH